MTMSSLLKEIYDPVAEYTAYYTGGVVEWTLDGTQMLCQCNDTIQAVDINTGNVSPAITKKDGDEEDDNIYTFALSSDDKILSAHRSGLLKLWSIADRTLLKMWRSAHKGPVACVAFDPGAENVASGGADGIIRLWNIAHQTCTGSLRGALGVFTVLRFHPIREKALIFAAADDTKIRSWDTLTGKEVFVYSGHFSKVTSLQFTSEGKHMVSSGRDKVIILWTLDTGKALRTLPIYEGIEGAIILPNSFNLPNFTKKVESDDIFVACAGEKGIIKVWNMTARTCVHTQQSSLVSSAAEEGGLAITDLLFNEAKCQLAVITYDHNIIIHDLESLLCVKQMVGFSDEILDVIYFGHNDSYIAVATNSHDVKVYDLSTMNCNMLKGHTDIVLALSKFPSNPNAFLSSGKDNSVRLWLKNCDQIVLCVAVGARHTASVGSICASQLSESFFVSVSQDMCLKLWNIPDKLQDSEVKTLKCSHTEMAHQMDINNVSVSPNDKIIATGSQDKTAKLWSTEDLSLLGVLRGHRRGVWSVKFSPVDQVLLTSSADCTLKLWSLSELNCLKTFEGHESSVLRADFLTKGLQIISTGADGLVKMWNIKSSECKMSLDKHDGKVWALAVSTDESNIITGCSDSKLIKWKDVTVEKKDNETREKEELIQQEQELMNLVHDKKLTKALKLALRLEKPLHVLRIINEILNVGDAKLKETIKEINTTQKEALLRCAVEWNTNNRHCHAAQIVFYILSGEMLARDLYTGNQAALLEGALPYTERHFDRLTSLMQDLNFITYTVNCMQPHGKVL